MSEAAAVAGPLTSPEPVLPRPALVMPQAVLGQGSDLSSAGRQAVQGLSGDRPLRFGIALLRTWISIAAIITVGVWADRWWVTLICIILIGGRQSVLGLLLHEQVHRLGWRSKYADWLVNLFAAFPLFVTTVEDYAKVHLSHHKYFFTPKDPDFLRKAGAEWTYPKALGAFLLIALKDITALNLVKLIKGKSGGKIAEFERRTPTPVWLRLAFFAVLATVLTVLGGWKIFLLYWVVPAMTFTQLIVRWIAISEHQYNIEDGTVHETTPLLQQAWWEKLVLPNMNFGYHAYHHMHPGVSFSNLPKVHAIYQKEGLVDETKVFRSQGALLKFLLSPRAREAEQARARAA
jgi:fatty acid desaturase